MILTHLIAFVLGIALALVILAWLGNKLPDDTRQDVAGREPKYLADPDKPRLKMAPTNGTHKRPTGHFHE